MLANLALEFHTQIFVYSSMILLDPAAEDMCDPSHLAKRNIEIYCKGLRKKGLNLVQVPHFPLLLRPRYGCIEATNSSCKDPTSGLLYGSF